MGDRQPPTTALAAVLALSVVLAMVPAFAVADSAADPLTVRADTPINSQEQRNAFQSEGLATAELTAPVMRIDIATDRKQVGVDSTLNPLDGSTRNDFIRLEYREEISRTVEIPIHADYWDPFPREGLQSISSDHTANLRPVEINGTEYTMISVTFNGTGSAVFPIPSDAVAAYSATERVENAANSTLGINLGLTPTPWTELRPEVFTGNNTAVRLEGKPSKMMIQYNAGTAENPSWVPVPDKQRRNVPVYRMTKTGVDGAVYVVSATTDTPPIRYKFQHTWTDVAQGYVNSAQELPGKVLGGLGMDVDIPFLQAGVV